MRRSLLLLSLLPALALAQFLPRKTTLNQTLNIDTTLNTDTVNGNTVDAGELFVAGDSELTGNLLLGGNLTVNGTSTQIGVASFGTMDGGSMYLTGPASVDGALQIAGTSTLAGDVSIADGGASALTVDALTVNQSMAAINVDELTFGNADGGTLSVIRIVTPVNILDIIGPNGTVYEFALSAGGWIYDGLHAQAPIESSSSVLIHDNGSFTVEGPATFADAGFGLNVAIGGALEVPGTASVNGVLEFDVADGGALYLSGAAYLTSQQTTGAASVNGLFEFDVGDGGYLGLSGNLDVAGSATFGPTSVAGYLGSTGDAGVNNLVATGSGSFGGYVGGNGDAGFNAIVATGGIQPNESGSYITFYLKTTHAALDLADTATGACTSQTTETVNGALLGDVCFVSSGIALEAGGHYECSVTNTNEAKWQMCVSTGAGNINHSEDTFTIRVLR